MNNDCNFERAVRSFTKYEGRVELKTGNNIIVSSFFFYSSSSSSGHPFFFYNIIAFIISAAKIVSVMLSLDKCL